MSSVIVSIKYNSYSVYLLIADSCPHVAPPCDPHPWSPMTSAMALGSRNFAESNTAMLMPPRTATVRLGTVLPWVLQNPRHFHAAIAALTPCTNLMSARIVTKEKKMKLFHANAAS